MSQDEGCPTIFDSVLCWPKTPPATQAFLPCFEEFKGVQYDTSQNATRFCHINGQWDNYTNYDLCHHVVESSPRNEFDTLVEVPIFIYITGYIISLIALIISVVIFTKFKDLRCLRNTIHANLFITYILSSLLWILSLVLQMFVKLGSTGCIFLVTTLHYFSLTNFFWMLVEGLYLYMLVVETFSDNIRLRLYAFIGWGGPAVAMTCWAIAKSLMPASSLSGRLKNEPVLECSWMEESPVDWFYQGPVCAVLIINTIFLSRIMWVLITKLRSANTVETRQYRKASKALLVLKPLLGITYLLVLIGPDGSSIFAIARALLLSTQGFSVSLFYCFLNSEVRQVLRNHLYRWRDERNIGSGKQTKSRRYKSSNGSRTESTRLTSISSVH